MQPEETATKLAVRLRERRLAHNLSQEGLSERSGVPLGTLKQFERTGKISLLSFIRLLVALKEETGLNQLLNEPQPFETLEDVLKQPKRRQRGRRT